MIPLSERGKRGSIVREEQNMGSRTKRSCGGGRLSSGQTASMSRALPELLLPSPMVSMPSWSTDTASMPTTPAGRRSGSSSHQGSPNQGQPQPPGQHGHHHHADDFLRSTMQLFLLVTPSRLQVTESLSLKSLFFGCVCVSVKLADSKHLRMEQTSPPSIRLKRNLNRDGRGEEDRSAVSSSSSSSLL